MTTPIENFFRLSREIREMIYDLVLEPVEFSNLYTAKTAYTPETCPLLYVHWKITEELQHHLYKNHALVIPFQEPSEYILNNGTFAQHIDNPTRRMKMKTDKIIVEIVQTKKAIYPQNPRDITGRRKHSSIFWMDREAGRDFPRRVVHELLQMKDHLPAVRTVEFELWEGEWYMNSNGWREPLQRLLDNWDELHIEVQMNLFDFDGRMDNINAWCRHFEPIEEISFFANGFSWDDHEARDYWGRRIDPRGFASDYWNEMAFEILEMVDEFYFTEDVECRPLFVKPYMDKAQR
ncbi:hypothetical protein CEP54_002725 [Fusarium duplospermum]|uniref:Uncharacterized protein n=1 Tax=Fusarium duplospermum TaxID=1325734 RepID=A0A428QTR4_9HYPO|nr:hypothetical protein CEP54_002725 [Fusarium duplospermum]